MEVQQRPIDEGLARLLVTSQFPQWAGLPILPVSPGGWDNRTFRLGEEMLVRLPSASAYAAQVEKEQRWLPRLAPRLPLAIPVPMAIGKPAGAYPWKWSIYRWLVGNTDVADAGIDLRELAISLARFLLALQRIDTAGGPAPGPHNFHRGGALMRYDAETRRAIATLKDSIDMGVATEIWEAALETTWNSPPLWIHGDISAGNLLMHEGRLSAVIDFGNAGIGDPACDLSIAWTVFNGESRDVYRALLPLGAGTGARGRGWALWKALIVAAGPSAINAVERAQSLRVIDDLLAEHGKIA